MNRLSDQSPSKNNFLIPKFHINPSRSKEVSRQTPLRVSYSNTINPQVTT